MPWSFKNNLAAWREGKLKNSKLPIHSDYTAIMLSFIFRVLPSDVVWTHNLPFQGLSLHLENQKVTLQNLVAIRHLFPTWSNFFKELLHCFWHILVSSTIDSPESPQSASHNTSQRTKELHGVLQLTTLFVLPRKPALTPKTQTEISNDKDVFSNFMELGRVWRAGFWREVILGFRFSLEHLERHHVLCQTY